jgi:Flp pilus assembly protein TadB
MNGYDNSIVDLLRSTIRDAQELVRGEIALARAELREEVRRVGSGAALLVAAGIGALLALAFLMAAAALGIAAVLQWPAWAGFAIIGGIVALLAVVLGLKGRRQLNAERHMPRTVDTMKENLQWMRARTS